MKTLNDHLEKKCKKKKRKLCGGVEERIWRCFRILKQTGILLVFEAKEEIQLIDDIFVIRI